METDYPWEGQVRVVVESAPAGLWRLALRVPQWADHVTLSLNGEAAAAEPQDSWLTVGREWAAGDDLVLDLALEVRFTRPDPRVDAARGCLAIERGPLVYCLEAVDNPGQRLDDLVLEPDRVS